jgi:hypothetical protein
MAQVAYTVAGLAVAAALASWIAGAAFYVRTLRAIARTPEPRGLMLRALVAWPFAVGRLQREAALHAASVNKALVAVIACLIIAVSAISVATNLARVSR